MIIVFVRAVCGQCSLMLLLQLFWGHHELCPYKMVNLINVCVLTAPQTGYFPVLGLLLLLYGPPYSLRYNIEIRQLGIIQCSLSVHMKERVSYLSF